MEKKFSREAADPQNPSWAALVRRPAELYAREDDIRSPFARDYTRILHSLAYRRLKHKTQVFFNIENDHICTRMEHVAHVASVACTIARELGLNVELARAMALGHDLGHAPFGHHGEKVLDKISREYLGRRFWHEGNGLRFVDHLELLEDTQKQPRNLNLTYAVRDGIVCHCGEVAHGSLRPRGDCALPLEDISEPGRVQPATWEGCVVKISDKIAYLGRDIEDAESLGFMDEASREELRGIVRRKDDSAVNTTVIIHSLIIDLCCCSSPEKGLCLSPESVEFLEGIRKFNYRRIYSHQMLGPFMRYAELVLNELFGELMRYYSGGHFAWQAFEENRRFHPELAQSFMRWLALYCDPAVVPPDLPSGLLSPAAQNEKPYGRLDSQEIYVQAVLDFISGMTDRYAVKVYNELLTY